MASYKIFEINGGAVTSPVKTGEVTLEGAGVTIRALTLGELGRGRVRALIPVEGGETVDAARIGATRSGRVKLTSGSAASADPSAVLLVLRTGMGFRGGNFHTGDRSGWKCSCGGEGEEWGGPPGGVCPQCGAERKSISWGNGWAHQFAPLPGQVLARGIIAEGAAGRMGAGEQLLLLLPRGEVIRWGTTGRGAGPTRYGRWDGEKFTVLTAEEREVVDLF